MDHREFHVMNAELIHDRRTMRYSCPLCHRCMEDGPEGLTVLQPGDRAAVHRAGTLKAAVEEIDQTAPPAAPTLH